MPNIQLDALVGEFSWYLLPLFRIAAFIMVAPIFSTNFVPTKIKVLVAVVLAVTTLPFVTPDPNFDVLSLSGFMTIFYQIGIGAALGLVMQIIFASAVSAGHIVGMQMGLGFAQMMDPATGVSVPVISQFYNLMAVLLFLALNGHLVMIEILVGSFTVLPVGEEIFPGEMLLSLAYFGAWIFSGALVIALPAVVSLLMISVVMGVITRSSPQMNIFAVGFSISITAGFVIIAVTLSTAFPQMSSMFNEGFIFMRNMLAG